MAEAVGQLPARRVAPARARQTVATARAALGWTVLAGAIIFFLGTSWDIQWHTYVGRDRTLIAPHLMMLGGVALSGIAALLAIVFESAGPWRNTTPGTPFAGIFQGPLGAYVAGFGALDAALAFPLDSYWHALYGIDVAIWAPFHVMFLVGMGIVALGAVFMLIAARNLAGLSAAPGVERAAYLGTLAAFATILGLFTILLFDAMDSDNPHNIDLGLVQINVFPLLAGALGAWVLVAAARAVPGRWTATRVAACYMIFPIVVGLLVPPVTDLLLQIEQLTYRPGREDQIHIAMVMFEWPVIPLLAGFLIDRLLRLRGPDGDFLLTRSLVARAALCAIPVTFLLPIGLAILLFNVGILGTVLSLLVGVAGAAAGVWLGRNMGAVLQGLER